MSDLTHIYEKLIENKNIGGKIKLGDDKAYFEIEFHEYLHIRGDDDVLVFTLNKFGAHWHHESDEEMVKRLTDIADGELVFIEDTRKVPLKRIVALTQPWNHKIISRDELEKFIGKGRYKTHHRIYSGNMIFKRENNPNFTWELMPPDSPAIPETYLIPRNELTSSLHYEFQAGKYEFSAFKSGKSRLADSLYLYEYHNYSAMVPLSFFIKDFAQTGITYLGRSDAETFIKYLRDFAGLLKSGTDILQSLERLSVYNPRVDGSWSFEDGVQLLDLIKLQKTAEVLANWTEEQLKTYDMISILGM